MDSEILDTQIEIAGTAAPTGHEDARAQLVASRLAAFGLDVRRDEVGNVIARHAGVANNAEPVVVASHLDTVFPADTPLTIAHAGLRVVGPGICDNARGLSAMLALARVLSRSPDPRAKRPVEFVATVGEEGLGDLRGARHYMATSPRPFALLALDGAGDERIVNTGLGSRRFRVEYRGPGGHSWNAFGTANPIHAAAQAAGALASIRLPSGATLTVSRIGGGLSVNSIPADAWFEVDVRSTQEATLARLERELRDAVSAAAENENGRATRGAITVAVERIGARPAGDTAEGTDMVQAAVAATKLVGRTPTLAVASTDANAAMVVGVPAIAIGGGGKGGDTHSTKEWYENAGATAGVQRALTLLVTLSHLV
jgi:tripeptide aminopeptidase